jgi:hypothetical protein
MRIPVPDPDSVDSLELDLWGRCQEHASILGVRAILRARELPDFRRRLGGQLRGLPGQPGQRPGLDPDRRLQRAGRDLRSADQPDDAVADLGRECL